MSAPEQTKHYFLPVVRQGLAAFLKKEASDRTDEVKDNPHRARLELGVKVRARRKGTNNEWDWPESDERNKPISMPLDLYGPGDILGFEQRVVSRVHPEPDVGDFEPNYFPAVEFADPDFAWRFSADAAKENDTGELTPWITLIVLVAEDRGDLKSEFIVSETSTKALPKHIVVKEGALPTLDDIWRWAHVHVTAEEGLEPDQLLSRVTEAPEEAISRLLCPRRLAPGTRYEAFVVPTFRLGALAGLGVALDGETKATDLAWLKNGDRNFPHYVLSSDEEEKLPEHLKGETVLKLPYYFRWEFRTGLRGDFEHLVRLLEARDLGDKLGKRDMDCGTPGLLDNGIERPEIDPPKKRRQYLGLEGALKSLKTKYTPWGQDKTDPAAEPKLPTPFQIALADLINKPVTEHLAFREFAPTIGTSNAINDVEARVLPSGTEIEVSCRTVARRVVVVEYGKTPSFGQVALSKGGPGWENYHWFVLEKLEPGESYQFRIVATNEIIKILPNGEIIVVAPADIEETLDGSFELPPIPSVTPPIYGRWHYGRRKGGGESAPIVEPDDQSAWIDQLNLDPRHRAAAGLGAQVVRKRQESLMASAWEQLGAIESTNDLVRRAQFGREASLDLYRRLEQMRPEDFLRSTAPVHSRILMKDPQTQDRLTVRHYLRERTRIGEGALDPAFQRIARHRGPLRRRVRARRSKDMLARLASGNIEPAGPPPKPLGTTRVCDITKWLLLLLKRLPPYKREELRFCDGEGGEISCDQIVSQVEKGALDPLEEDASAPSPIEMADLMCAALSWLDQELPDSADQPQADEDVVSRVAKTVYEALDPAKTIVARTHQRLRLGGSLVEELMQTQRDPLDPIMSAPEFPQAMYEPLRDLSHALMVPGVEKIPQNTLGLLETNRRFLESYIVGLNHEFASELLWRGYPTDQRGTYFRQFWDVNEYVPSETDFAEVKPSEESYQGSYSDWKKERGFIDPILRGEKERILTVKLDTVAGSIINTLLSAWRNESDDLSYTPGSERAWILGMIQEEQAEGLKYLTEDELNLVFAMTIKKDFLAEKLKDITSINEWGDVPLGYNQPKYRTAESIVLVVRGDLLKRYPQTLIYAIDAVPIDCSNGDSVPGLPEFLKCYSEDPEGAEELDQEKIAVALKDIKRIYPIFKATLPPDLTFFGFPFDEDAARGDFKKTDEGVQGTNRGKFFVLEEPASEPRFGLDAPGVTFESIESWDELSWSHFSRLDEESELDFGLYLDDGVELTVAEPPNDAWKWKNENETSSATRASITLQKPVRIAVHARKMLPQESTQST